MPFSSDPNVFDIIVIKAKLVFKPYFYFISLKYSSWNILLDKFLYERRYRKSSTVSEKTKKTIAGWSKIIYSWQIKPRLLRSSQFTKCCALHVQSRAIRCTFICSYLNAVKFKIECTNTSQFTCMYQINFRGSLANGRQ